LAEESREASFQQRVFALKTVEPKEVLDGDLIAAVLEGSEDAFQQLVERYQERVSRLLMRFVRDRFAVEDLLQEVFLKVFRKLHTFNQDSALFTWIYRISVNAATDYLDRQGRRRLRLVEDVTVVERDEREAGHAGAAEPLMEAEMRRVTREVLETLPDKYRTILILREYQDLSYTEMAEVLGCSIGTVESRLFRARKRFKEALERAHPDLVPQPRGGHV
jgi:RNA polymerase sigma-70 factor (ECF subfamily)